MTQIYEPRAGSSGGKAVAYLRANGRTPEAALAAAIELEMHEIKSMLAYPVRMGSLKWVRERDNVTYWELGDGLPQQTEPLPKPSPAAAPAPETEAPRTTKAEPAKVEPPPAKPAHFRCALYNDGLLFLQNAAGHSVELQADETRQLVEYLQRLVPEEAAA